MRGSKPPSTSLERMDKGLLGGEGGKWEGGERMAAVTAGPAKTARKPSEGGAAGSMKRGGEI